MGSARINAVRQRLGRDWDKREKRLERRKKEGGSGLKSIRFNWDEDFEGIFTRRVDKPEYKRRFSEKSIKKRELERIPESKVISESGAVYGDMWNKEPRGKIDPKVTQNVYHHDIEPGSIRTPSKHRPPELPDPKEYHDPKRGERDLERAKADIKKHTTSRGYKAPTVDAKLKSARIQMARERLGAVGNMWESLAEKHATPITYKQHRTISWLSPNGKFYDAEEFGGSEHRDWIKSLLKNSGNNKLLEDFTSPDFSTSFLDAQWQEDSGFARVNTYGGGELDVGFGDEPTKAQSMAVQDLAISRGYKSKNVVVDGISEGSGIGLEDKQLRRRMGLHKLGKLRQRIALEGGVGGVRKYWLYPDGKTSEDVRWHDHLHFNDEGQMSKKGGVKITNEEGKYGNYFGVSLRQHLTPAQKSHIKQQMKDYGFFRNRENVTFDHGDNKNDTVSSVTEGFGEGYAHSYEQHQTPVGSEKLSKLRQRIADMQEREDEYQRGLGQTPMYRRDDEFSNQIDHFQSGGVDFGPEDEPYKGFIEEEKKAESEERLLRKLQGTIGIKEHIKKPLPKKITPPESGALKVRNRLSRGDTKGLWKYDEYLDRPFTRIIKAKQRIAEIGRPKQFNFKETLNKHWKLAAKDPRFKAFTHSSSFVGNVKYDQDEQSMQIILNGKTYDFCNVEERLFDSFSGAGSKGAFFNREIKLLHNCGAWSAKIQVTRERIAGLDFSKYKKKDQRRSATPDIMAQQFGDPENIKKSFPGKKIREFYNEALTGDLSRDYQVREIDVKAYLNSKERTCPGCQRNYRDFPSLSRDDNKTELCPGCGLAEAVRDEGTTKAMQPKRTGTGRWDFE